MDIERLLRGTDTVVPEEEFRDRLAEGKPLRVKLGMDPTAPTVTLGWAVVLRKLRHFQEQGHTAVLIVGDFTAQVGDPSGKSETRKRLSADEVRGYAENVLEGFKKVLIWDDEVLEVRYNSEWLSQLDMADVLELTSKMTLAQMLERDDFAKRFGANQPISMMEFMYPLLQGMDSVAIDADIELGGSDQLWNNLVGRELMGRYGKRPQMVMTLPLLVGTDGVQKMSQSLGNYIGVDDEPGDMFGKVMSIPDEAMEQYFRLATGMEENRIDQILGELADGSAHPGEMKRLLGRDIVELYHGVDAAIDAEAAFDRIFRQKDAPDEVPDHIAGEGDPVWLPGLLKDAGLVKSSSEGKRLVSQGAVKIEGETVGGEEVARTELLGRVVQVGKRRFVRFVDG
ncbi:MAG: tyrosine--tRNA ligase [Acidimicrobiia bacterium]|nr:tyrosine--tRNA ligase [Acidimicrobiia bacterium]NNF10171.1 tyrosine--tRNA ligase [Acidimicrobiia bacterium]